MELIILALESLSMGLGHIGVILTVSAAVMTGGAVWTLAVALYEKGKVS